MICYRSSGPLSCRRRQRRENSSGSSRLRQQRLLNPAHVRSADVDSAGWPGIGSKLFKEIVAARETASGFEVSLCDRPRCEQRRAMFFRQHRHTMSAFPRPRQAAPGLRLRLPPAGTSPLKSPVLQPETNETPDINTNYKYLLNIHRTDTPKKVYSQLLFYSFDQC